MLAERRQPPSVLEAYAAHDSASIGGLLQSGAVSVLLSLIELQDAFGVPGNVAEIGVHHGKTLILLALALRRGERAAGLEIFGRPPGSDAETRTALDANLARFGCAEACEIIVGDSTKFDARTFAARLGAGSVRLFSVDGDHTRDAVLHDLTLANAVLAPGGVIIADDLFNPWYPTVTEALYDFFRDGAHDLQPVALIAANGPVETGAGKLLIARRAFAYRYKAGLKLLNQHDLKHCDPFAGFADVPCFYFAETPVRRALNPALRAILDEIAAA